MKIVLRADVDNLGHKGDLVDVADGLRPQLPRAQGLRVAGVRRASRSRPTRCVATATPRTAATARPREAVAGQLAGRRHDRRARRRRRSPLRVGHLDRHRRRGRRRSSASRSTAAASSSTSRSRSSGPPSWRFASTPTSPRRSRVEVVGELSRSGAATPLGSAAGRGMLRAIRVGGAPTRHNPHGCGNAAAVGPQQRHRVVPLPSPQGRKVRATASHTVVADATGRSAAHVPPASATETIGVSGSIARRARGQPARDRLDGATRAGDGAVAIPPHNLEAEESLLGAMMLSREAITAAVEAHIEAGDFYKPAHGVIYDAALSLHSRGEPIDPVTVAEELRRGGQLDALGGRARAAAHPGGDARVGERGALRADRLRAGDAAAAHRAPRATSRRWPTTSTTTSTRRSTGPSR